MTFDELEATNGGKSVPKDTGCCTVPAVPQKYTPPVQQQKPDDHLGAVEQGYQHDWQAICDMWGFERGEYAAYGPNGEVRLKSAGGFDYSFKVPRD